MASSKDFEKIWESYQEVVKTKDISIVDYCQRNGIVYSQFQRWYKKHVSGVSIVPVSDPVIQQEFVDTVQKDPEPIRQTTGLVKTRVSYVNIEFSNGLKVCQKSMSYEHLKKLVELLKLKLLKVGSFLNIDETWCRIRIKIKGDGTKLGHYFKKYIWILINKIEQVAYFLYDNDENDSRGYRPISSFLSGFKGTVASDAYVVYKQLCIEHPDILIYTCKKSFASEG